MQKNLTLRYLYQILRAKWKTVLLSALILSVLAGVLTCFLTPLYQSELLFELRANRGFGGEDDPYVLFELSPEVGSNHVDNTLIELSSSLLYRKAADEFFPEVTALGRDSLGEWLDEMLRVERIGTTTLLQITCWSEDPYFSQKLLNRFFDFVQQENRLEYEQISLATIRFLEERLSVLVEEIDRIDEGNVSFLQESHAVNSSLAYVADWKEYMQHVNAEEGLQAELQVLLFLQDYMKKTFLDEGFLPAFPMSSPRLTAQIQKYNESWVLYDKLRGNSAPEASVLHQKQKELVQLREAVLGSLKSEVEAIRIRLKQVRIYAAGSEKNFSEASDGLTESYANRRQLRAMLNTYVVLSLKLEEVQIKRVIYVSNFRLIEPATYNPFPMRPRYAFIFLFALFVGVCMPIFLFVLFDRLNYMVTERALIERCLHIDVFESIPLGAFQQDAFERMRAELFFHLKDAKVLFFTSTLSHEGKTYIARNLALTLSKGNCRVVLIDADIRKATQSKILNLDQKNGLSSYLAGEVERVEDVIFSVEGCPDLSLIPCGIIPSNPSELLAGSRWETLVAHLRERYDYVVIDSVPAQLVADAVTSARVADVSFYVLRSGMIDRRYLSELNSFFSKSYFPNAHMLLNGFRSVSKKTGI